MTAAQKTAKEKFKKAIAYRKKTGCSLKEAFAHVYGKKKIGLVKKKAAKKKAAPKKKAASKKKAARNYGSHKDTKSHNVNIRVVSGIDDKSISNLNYLVKELHRANIHFAELKKHKKDKKIAPYGITLLRRFPGYIKSLKKQISEVKKNIK